jgi:putative methyltransferase (TIGR04325 family)
MDDGSEVCQTRANTMATDGRQASGLLDERDPTPVGERVEPPYFFGVFEAFQHTDNDPFSTDGWISHCQAMIQSWSPPVPRAKTLVRRLLGRRIPVPRHLQLVVERIEALVKSRGTARVVDVGGGFGDNYHSISQSLGRLARRVRYTVVDNEVQCRLGRSLYGRGGVEFVADVPTMPFDIAIVVGVLQLIPDWKNLVSVLCGVIEDSIFVSRTPLNLGGRTFVTVQSICPLLGSHALRKLGESNAWVINESELDDQFRAQGFRLEKSVFNLDYSSHCARLPEGHRHVVYIDKQFVKDKRA